MMSGVLELFRCVALSGMLLAAPSSSESLAPALPNSDQARNEVRLRKLHLVRPDLIPYPISYEIIC